MATAYNFKKSLVFGLKGLTGLLLLKAVLIIGILAFQACKKDNASSRTALQKTEADKFRALLRQRGPEIKRLLSRAKQSDAGRNGLLGKSHSPMATIPVDGLDPLGPGVPQRTLDGEYTYEEVEQIKIEMTPIVNQGRTLIYSYGISDQDLIEEWGTATDPELITRLAYGISGYEEELRNSPTLELSVTSLFGTAAYAEGLWECIKSAIGVEAAMEMIRTRSLSTIAGKKAFIRAIGKTATRYLGWVGAAIAVADFIDCYW